jgi:tRNA threonylcarbamoyladenosine biosynthesis protein TsaE
VIPALSSHHLKLNDEAATRAFAEQVAKAMLEQGLVATDPGLVIFLRGPLGAGKTTFVRYLLRSLGHPSRVRSPSFTIMEPYPIGALNVYHFDFYRFNTSEEWRDAGFDELIGAGGSLSLIEWPERVEQGLPTPDLLVSLALPELHTANASALEVEDNTGPEGRTAMVSAYSPVGENILRRVHQQ